MSTQSGRNTRTLSGYVSTLLDYPRWIIERDIDFTDCHHCGVHNDFIAECADCRFGDACRWLNKDHSPGPEATSLNELVLALHSAMQYLQAKEHHERNCSCRTCAWLREARKFLHARRHIT